MRRVHLIVIKNSCFTWQVYGFLHSRVGYYLSKYIGNQKTFVSWISSIFTALMAIPPLLAKKFLKNSKDITNCINSIVQSDSTTTTSTDTSDSSPLLDSINALETFFNFQNNVEGIKEVRSQLIQFVYHHLIILQLMISAKTVVTHLNQY